jgi:hypothetical protein
MKHSRENRDQRSTTFTWHVRARARACVCVCVCVCVWSVCVWSVPKPDLASFAEVLCRRVRTSQVRKVRLKRNTVHQIVTSSRRHGRACDHSENYNALRGSTIHSRSYLASLYQMSRLFIKWVLKLILRIFWKLLCFRTGVAQESVPLRQDTASLGNPSSSQAETVRLYRNVGKWLNTDAATYPSTTENATDFC